MVVTDGIGELVEGESVRAVGKGASIPPGANVRTAAATLSITLPDGTLLKLRPGTNVHFAGRTDAHPEAFSIDVFNGEVALDTRKRTAGAAVIAYRLTTPLHTIVAFRATSGSINVATAVDRITCSVCARGDFSVRSSTRRIELDKDGKVATVTPDQGIVVALDPPRDSPNSGGLFIGNVIGAIIGSYGAINSRPAQLPRVDEVALELQKGVGDRVPIDTCLNQVVRLALSGGQPPYHTTSRNESVVHVLGFGPSAGIEASARAVIAAEMPGRTDVTATDDLGDSALLSVRVVSSTSPVCHGHGRAG